MTFYLYDQVGISVEQLTAAVAEVADRWPTARLHKSDITSNIRIVVDDELVGQIDLLNGRVDDFGGSHD